MMNNNLYTAVGKFHIKGSVGGMRCPVRRYGGLRRTRKAVPKADI